MTPEQVLGKERQVCVSHPPHIFDAPNDHMIFGRLTRIDLPSGGQSILYTALSSFGERYGGEHYIHDISKTHEEVDVFTREPGIEKARKKYERGNKLLQFVVNRVHFCA
jgi:hypothetical protein